MMRVAEWINLLFFSLFIVLAWLRPLPWRARRNALAIGAAGIDLLLIVQFLQRVVSPLTVSVVRDWLPAPLILAAYWQAGQFVRKPQDAMQTTLERWDRRVLGAGPRDRWDQTWVCSYLELAYFFCYPLIPLGLMVLYSASMKHAVDAYWAIVLPSAYVCYALIPFMQTLPPWMLTREREGPSSKLRTLNLWLLRRASNHINTFPSAHVASTIAASLVLLRLVPLTGAIFLGVTISLSLGAVIGRYHYVADVVLGGGLAIAIFLLVTFVLV